MAHKHINHEVDHLIFVISLDRQKNYTIGSIDYGGGLVAMLILPHDEWECHINHLMRQGTVFVTDSLISQYN